MGCWSGEVTPQSREDVTHHESTWTFTRDFPLQYWKFRRELNRIRLQLQAIPEFFYEPWLRRWHDLRRRVRLRSSPGIDLAADKVAIYLVYQPTGLQASTLLACRHLRAQGYSPLVISNAPLSGVDRRRLLQEAWAVVERPNFGYDFGGYRDGILLLEDWSVRPRSLILMNDSIWFPAREGDDTIRRMEQLRSEFCGVLMLGSDAYSRHPRHREPFLGSFFLLFKDELIQHPAFRRFWLEYRSTSNKYKTIRRGERGLSNAMRDAGFEGASLFRNEEFHDHVGRLSYNELLAMLHGIVTIDPELREEIRKTLEQAEIEDPSQQGRRREDLRRMIVDATKKGNIFSTAPICMLDDFQISFVKKSKDPQNLIGLKKIVEIMNTGRLRTKLVAEVREEIQLVVSSFSINRMDKGH